jgi:hypothetical protein
MLLQHQLLHHMQQNLFFPDHYENLEIEQMMIPKIEIYPRMRATKANNRTKNEIKNNKSKKKEHSTYVPEIFQRL